MPTFEGSSADRLSARGEALWENRLVHSRIDGTMVAGIVHQIGPHSCDQQLHVPILMASLVPQSLTAWLRPI
jgi:hypothetical protein